MKIGDFYDTSVITYRIKLLSCNGICVRSGNSKRSKNKRIRPQPRAPTD